jgi:hypothetical protein
VVKNKLSGWHGIVHTDLEYKIARYVSWHIIVHIVTPT